VVKKDQLEVKMVLIWEPNISLTPKVLHVLMQTKHVGAYMNGVLIIKSSKLTNFINPVVDQVPIDILTLGAFLPLLL
jgi:hypothetical protein